MITRLKHIRASDGTWQIVADIQTEDATVLSVDLADTNILTVQVNNRYRRITPQGHPVIHTPLAADTRIDRRR
ncbi:hypothetical protein D1871_20280 [Nakamurella silvestris]|nr:hypothetical protein D1871_20280 [Nakamurella silvestris]